MYLSNKVFHQMNSDKSRLVSNNKIKMNDLRKQIMVSQQIIASKSRFGLFSQPPPLAIGDDSSYTKNKLHIGQNGKPVTDPPQLLAGPSRSGNTKSAFFMVSSSILQNDPYRDKFKIDNEYYRKMHTRSKMHESQFIPSSSSKILDKSSYKYMNQNPQYGKKPKIERDQMGKVITGKKNFTTNSIRKVESQFFKPASYILDPYERKQQLNRKQKAIFKSKLIQSTFSPTSHGNKLFTKDLLVFGEDPKTKLLLKNRSMPKSLKAINSGIQHEAAFIPARRGHGDPLGKYPQHMPKQRQKLSLQKSIQHSQQRQKWVPNGKATSRPTPSISLNPTNLKLHK